MLQEHVVCWSGTLERERILAEQRPAPPVNDGRNGRNFTECERWRQIVSAFLQRHPQWWTMKEMGTLLCMRTDQVYSALRVLYEGGLVVKQQPKTRGRRGKPQRYRWKA